MCCNNGTTVEVNQCFHFYHSIFFPPVSLLLLKYKMWVLFSPMLTTFEHARGLSSCYITWFHVIKDNISTLLKSCTAAEKKEEGGGGIKGHLSRFRELQGLWNERGGKKAARSVRTFILRNNLPAKANSFGPKQSRSKSGNTCAEQQGRGSAR